MHLADLTKKWERKARSISPENLTGQPGMGGRTPLEDGTAREEARDLGFGWKVNPYVDVQPGETFVMADIQGSGIISHIWLTPTGKWRSSILRMYWDGQQKPSVECPVGDFFCAGWQEYVPINSMSVCVNPGSAFNCYWEMPFTRQARITLENRGEQPMRLYYQIDYCLCDVPEDTLYFHAQFHRVNPLPYKEVYTLVDGIAGKGQFVGVYMAWGVNNNRWWGEGEIKFFIDDDDEFPTICGTGTEDYFCGSYNFENKRTREYEAFSTQYAGFHHVQTDKVYQCQMRFGMYRWHITDPVYFDTRLRVTMQALGWRDGHRYLPLQDDIASVAYWYQTLPAADFPPLPDQDYLEVI